MIIQYPVDDVFVDGEMKYEQENNNTHLCCCARAVFICRDTRKNQISPNKNCAHMSTSQQDTVESHCMNAACGSDCTVAFIVCIF